MINLNFFRRKRKLPEGAAAKVETALDQLLKEMNTRAVIFDLDGTLIDNNSFHLISWKRYLKNMGREISEEEYKIHINGRTNKDAVEYIYGRKMKEEEAMGYALEKEEIYRKLYKPLIKPVPGLLQFLDELEKRGIPMAIATSGIQVNIDFMFDNIPIKKYFSVVVNSSHIRHGKPDPEIYLKTASMLDIPPKRCLVFEDSVVGIQAARAARMKVIAIATTHSREELAEADMVIENFNMENFKVNN
jgi:haloacid dehalogenase superfamily, subfamily IA, variant 3 with third motif having DD or ED/beta-phosphoglucomutase family hydrolase